MTPIQRQRRLGQQYVKNPQLRTSAFYPLHPQILSAKIIRILPVSVDMQICRRVDADTGKMRRCGVADFG